MLAAAVDLILRMSRTRRTFNIGTPRIFAPRSRQAPLFLTILDKDRDFAHCGVLVYEIDSVGLGFLHCFWWREKTIRKLEEVTTFT